MLNLCFSEAELSEAFPVATFWKAWGEPFLKLERAIKVNFFFVPFDLVQTSTSLCYFSNLLHEEIVFPISCI